MTYHSIDDIAELLGASRNTVKQWMKEGCPVIELSPRMVRIPRPAFDRWLREFYGNFYARLYGETVVTPISQEQSGSASGKNQLVEKTNVGRR